MALLIRGRTQCIRCGEVIAADDRIYATTHFIADPADPFHRYSDAAMHRRCFDAWADREAFEARYQACLHGIDSRTFPHQHPADHPVDVALDTDGAGLVLFSSHRRHRPGPGRSPPADPAGGPTPA